VQSKDFHGPLQHALEPAFISVGQLDSLSTLLPDTGLVLYAYVRKEAVLSSQIEGTQSSLADLLVPRVDHLAVRVRGNFHPSLVLPARLKRAAPRLSVRSARRRLRGPPPTARDRQMQARRLRSQEAA
jgi:hypothetical protein